VCDGGLSGLGRGSEERSWLQEERTGWLLIQKCLFSKWDRPAFARKSPLPLKTGFRTSHLNPIKLCLHE